MYLYIVVEVVRVQDVIQADFHHNPAFLDFNVMGLALLQPRETVAQGVAQHVVGNRLYQVICGAQLKACKGKDWTEGGEDNDTVLIRLPDSSGGGKAGGLPAGARVLRILQKYIQKYQVIGSAFPGLKKIKRTSENGGFLTEAGSRAVCSYIIRETAGVFRTVFNNSDIQGVPFFLKKKKGTEVRAIFLYKNIIRSSGYLQYNI